MMKSTFGRGLSRHANILLLLRQRELKMHHRKGNLRTYQVNGCWVYVGTVNSCVRNTPSAPLPSSSFHELIHTQRAEMPVILGYSPDDLPSLGPFPPVRGCFPFDLGLDKKKIMYFI